METRTCKQCRLEFPISSEDTAFYAKMQVPPPQQCPDCRAIRRLAWRNERVLYSRACDLCKKTTLSTYPANAPYTVYCRSCWWSDAWDPLEYGRPIDFSKPFFDQFDALMRDVPRNALMNAKTENSEFCNETNEISDSYMAICSFYGERMMYTYWFGWGSDCVDCSFTLQSNYCYDSQDLLTCHNCMYTYKSTKMTDAQFCFNSSDCVNCFMCVNVHHKSYMIRNTQYTKEEYERIMSQMNLGSYETVQALKKEFWEMTMRFPRPYAWIMQSEDCTGDYVTQSQNVRDSYDVFQQKNARYAWDSGMAVDSMDVLQSGMDCELMYETHSAAYLYNSAFVNWTWNGVDVQYVDSCHHLEYSFGCNGVRKKKFCILNTQYSEEEYKKLCALLVEHMHKTGEYGEFFPVELSPYAYNETVAQQWFPRSKEEITSRGWRWQDHIPGQFGKETMAWPSVPDDIADAQQEITKEIFACTQCTKNYRITPTEFAVYRERVIPLPRACPDCRFTERLSHRNPRRLWERTCMCAGAASENGVYTNGTVHPHAAEHCTRTFSSPYAPDRPEIIYCKACYQEELN